MATRSELEAFLARPWRRLRRSKDRWTAELAHAGAAGDLLNMSDALRAHAATLGLEERPHARLDDLDDLVRLKKKLDLASQRLSSSR